MSAGSVRMLRADAAEDRSVWSEMWKNWQDAEVFAHPAYVELFAGNRDLAMCAVMGSSSAPTIVAPFIIRQVPGEASIRDLTGPYGYGGPYVADISVSAADRARFTRALTEWAAENAIVTEFHRLHLFPMELADMPGERVHRSNNIVRTLNLSEDELWMDFEHKVRKNVKKAQRSGVTVSIHEDAAHFEQFHEVYLRTMERREASAGYHFSRSFFDTINRELAGAYAYAHAWIDERIVSTELVLVSGNRAYSFLGGTDSESFASRPNDLLKFEIMKWAKKRGLSAFVLGGGVSPGDGIERYKAAFAPSGVVPFYTAQRVFRGADYTRLCQRRAAELGTSIPPEYFPGYRAGSVVAGANT